MAMRSAVPVKLRRLLLCSVVATIAGCSASAHGGAEPSTAPAQASQATASDSAEEFVRSAVPAVLSIDYRNLTADHAKAMALATDPIASSLSKTFEAIRTTAVDQRAVSLVKVESADLLESSGDRARFDVGLETTRSNAATDSNPIVTRNRAEVLLQRVDGSWKISDIKLIAATDSASEPSSAIDAGFTVKDSDGYSYRVAFRLSRVDVTLDTANAKPGNALLTATSTASGEITNTTVGHNAEADFAAAAQGGIQAWGVWPTSSAVCKLRQGSEYELTSPKGKFCTIKIAAADTHNDANDVGGVKLAPGESHTLTTLTLGERAPGAAFSAVELTEADATAVKAELEKGPVRWMIGQSTGAANAPIGTAASHCIAGPWGLTVLPIVFWMSGPIAC